MMGISFVIAWFVVLTLFQRGNQFHFCSALSSTANPSSPGQLQQHEAPSSSSSSSWKPKVANLEERRKLRGTKHETETIGTIGFHHVEFYCGDAKSMANQFSLALGMPITGMTGLSTGNDQCISYGLQSGNLCFLLTAPYSQVTSSINTSNTAADSNDDDDSPDPLPGFSPVSAHNFFVKHGLAARAIGIEVKDVHKAFEASVARGAHPVQKPIFVPTCTGQKKAGISRHEGCYLAEVELYGDVVLRFITFVGNNDDDNIEQEPATDGKGKVPFLPNLSPVTGKLSRRKTFGLQRIDHAVGNVPDLLETQNRIQSFTGFHEFAEFTAEDVGTVDSGLNSVVLASDSEYILLPVNEPTLGKRKSQIQTYLEQNEGPGLQHLALKTKDIFETIELMRQSEEELGGFELMKRPSDQYYRELPDRLGDQLTPDQYEKLEKLGILADADDEGILLQIFTKPIGDRPTFFFEIIQRIGCRYEPEELPGIQLERPGCGGFGQGNFRELFKAIEDHEKTLKV